MLAPERNTLLCDALVLVPARLAGPPRQYPLSRRRGQGEVPTYAQQHSYRLAPYHAASHGDTPAGQRQRSHSSSPPPIPWRPGILQAASDDYEGVSYMRARSSLTIPFKYTKIRIM